MKAVDFAISFKLHCHLGQIMKIKLFFQHKVMHSRVINILVDMAAVYCKLLMVSEWSKKILLR